jgi:hypothetical protein
MPQLPHTFTVSVDDWALRLVEKRKENKRMVDSCIAFMYKDDDDMSRFPQVAKAF